MKQVDEIIYDAIRADAAIMAAISGRIVRTCFEVPPTDKDNTPLPNIIITDDGFQNQPTTKDEVWEADEDRRAVGVDVAATSSREVQQIIQMVRRAVAQHIEQMAEQGESVPYLESLSSEGLAWDWMKPCYYQRMTYHCIITVDYEQEN